MDTVTGRNTRDRLFHEDQAAGIFRYSARVYTDSELFEREQRRIFDRSWLYAAHDSEIPKVGDFLTRRVGGRGVLIARGSDGVIRAFHNSCRHRGTTVCRQPSGNAKNFQCFYHYWTYDNCGKLIGVPSKDSYGPGFKTEAMGLHEIRSQNYRGWLFLCFSRDTEPLEPYLAGARACLDMILDQDEGRGVAILPGAHEYSMRANWKMLIENSTDIYHLPSVHSRFMHDYLPNVLGIAPPDPRAARDPSSGARDLGNGHAVIEYRRFNGVADEARRPEFEARYGTERARRMLDFTRTLILFPNTIFIEQRRVIRTCYPLAPDHAEINAWPLMPVVDDPQARAQRLDIYLSFLGPAGSATPDDIEVMELCQKNCATLPDDAFIDCSRGMMRENPFPNEEEQMRAFWRRWRDLVAQ
jgi:phenylpropionate dioxygenase-like ring-hydroxylating dioxygenase large terminal subunit